MYKITINNLKEMKKFADILADIIQDGDVITLTGDLGAGKTTLVTFVAQKLNTAETPSSPTFSLVNIYNGDKKINHLDLYRIERPEEIESFEYEEYFYPLDSITFIEWPEKAGLYLPRNIIEIKIKKPDQDKRLIEISNLRYEIEIKERFRNEDFIN